VVLSERIIRGRQDRVQKRIRYTLGTRLDPVPGRRPEPERELGSVDADG
jgi:hypothetical protein